MKTEFPVLHTVKIGKTKGCPIFTKPLEERGYSVHESAELMINSHEFFFSLSRQSTEVDICIATVKELTGKNVEHMDKICKAVSRQGYLPCPPEAFIELLLQVEPDLLPDFLGSVMQELPSHGGGKRIFARSCSSFLGDYSSTGSGFEGKFVFVKPRT